MNDQPPTAPLRLVREPGVLAWLRLARVYQRLQRAAAEDLRRWDLSLAQFDVLAQVGADEGLTQQALADRLLVTKGNVSQLLDKLERAGLLERRRAGRVCALHLTPSGRALFERVVPAHEAFMAARMGRAALTPAELAELARLLRKLDRALTDRSDDPERTDPERERAID